MKKNNNKEMILAAALQDSKVPILILDKRWHELFPVGEKPAEIVKLETELNDLLKKQGKMVNELKDLKRAKKKLMDEIVSKMDKLPSKKSKQNQKLILEMNERIERDSKNIMNLPEQIRLANERLLIEGVKICYHRLQGCDQQVQDLINEIHSLQEMLDLRIEEKEKIEEENKMIYSYMHDLLGPEIVELIQDEKVK